MEVVLVLLFLIFVFIFCLYRGYVVNIDVFGMFVVKVGMSGLGMGWGWRL